MIIIDGAMPDSKLVVGVGACACGGVFRNGTMNRNGTGSVLPMDLYAPGARPTPIAILNGILKVMDNLPVE